MKLFTESLRETLTLPLAIKDYFSNCRVGVLDIETRGLSPNQHQVILGGLLVFDCGKTGRILQYFAETPAQERALLDSYFEEIKKCDLLVTYNGKSFDMNFLGIRGNKLGLKLPEFPYNLDLYLLIRVASDLKNTLPNLQQKTIENYMGLGTKRSDAISGLESIELYNNYLATGNDASLNKILLHNRDDLYQLYKLLDVIEACDIEKGFHHLGFPGTSNLQISQTKRNQHYLQIEGVQRHRPISYYSFGDFGESLQIAFDEKTRTFQIMVPIFQKDGDYFLDLVSLGMDEAILTKSPSYEKGFLILEEQGQFHYKTLNEFVRLLVIKVGKETETIK